MQVVDAHVHVYQHTLQQIIWVLKPLKSSLNAVMAEEVKGWLLSGLCCRRQATLSGAAHCKGAVYFIWAGITWREIFGGNKSAVCFPGGKFARRYIFFGGEVEPTHCKYVVRCGMDLRVASVESIDFSTIVKIS